MGKLKPVVIEGAIKKLLEEPFSEDLFNETIGDIVRAEAMRWGNLMRDRPMEIPEIRFDGWCDDHDFEFTYQYEEAPTVLEEVKLFWYHKER